MAQAQLTFNLDDQDDKHFHLRAIKSINMALALWDIQQHLRSVTKYAPDNISDETYKALQEVRDALNDILEDHSIDLDELLN